jgi:hypothetical protein
MRTKRLFILTLVLSFAAVATLSATPRYKERRSTRDLNRVDVKGKVERIEGRKATLRTDNGRRVTVHLGPQWYWRERNYRLDKGVDVEVRGYGEIGDQNAFVYPYEMEGEGFDYDFADENGYPRWAPDDDYYDGWYPSVSFYNDYYYCPPPPPPPPRYYWHGGFRHHYGPRYGYVWHPRGGWRWRPCRPHFGIHIGFWWP